MSAVPDRWHDAGFVERWKRDFVAKFRKDSERKRHGETIIKDPLFLGLPIAAIPDVRQALELAQAREYVTWENETLIDRAHRLEPESLRKQVSRRTPAQARHQVPAMLASGGRGGWFITPAARRATPDNIAQAKCMYDLGLTKKAQRQIACGVIGGEVRCKKCGEKFLAPYDCHGRYCPDCGPKEANRLFARKIEPLRFVAQRLMLCDVENCPECNQAIESGELPHWPPARAKRSTKFVCAKLDFTLRHEGTMPEPAAVRRFNKLIKKFFRSLERDLGITRDQYGFAYCDEFGLNNSNLHAHGVYVGPRLPQSKKGKELSRLWLKITGDSFIVSIKKADNFAQALYHAVKYPAKFATRSSPERRAELETCFHRVRRFHALARFYRPQAPTAPEPQSAPCPCCGGELGLSQGWETIAALRLRHLRTVGEMRAELGRAYVFRGDRAPP